MEVPRLGAAGWRMTRRAGVSGRGRASMPGRRGGEASTPGSWGLAGPGGGSAAWRVRYSTYSTYSKDPGESGGSAAWRVRYSTYSTYSKERRLGV